MSYLQFHAVFILPPLLLLAATSGPSLKAVGRKAGVLGIGLMALIALVYTTPWDNYLVARGVWGYGEGRVVGVIGYVPVEEYLFFVLQTVLAGLWLFRLLAGSGGVAQARPRPAARWGGVALWLVVCGLGVVLLRSESGLYLGLILAWAAPVLALQWAYGGHALWANGRSLALGVAVPTVYLWVADWLALGFDIWAISPRYTTGAEVLGMPVEEMVFFAVTTLMVAQGLILFLWVVESLQKRRVQRAAR